MRATVVSSLVSVSLFLSSLSAITPAFAQITDDSGTGTTPSTGTYCPILTSIFQRRATDASTHGQVSELQKFLADYYNLDDNILVGGIFGRTTQRYLIQFQTEQGLPAFGIAGSFTRAKIAGACENKHAGTKTSSTPAVFKINGTVKTAGVPSSGTAIVSIDKDSLTSASGTVIISGTASNARRVIIAIVKSTYTGNKDLETIIRSGVSVGITSEFDPAQETDQLKAQKMESLIGQYPSIVSTPDSTEVSSGHWFVSRSRVPPGIYSVVVYADPSNRISSPVMIETLTVSATEASVPSVFASIAPESLSHSVSSEPRIIGSAVGTNYIDVTISKDGTDVFATNKIPVIGGRWLVEVNKNTSTISPGTLSINGNYKIKIYSSATPQRESKLLLSNSFVVKGPGTCTVSATNPYVGDSNTPIPVVLTWTSTNTGTTQGYMSARLLYNNTFGTSTKIAPNGSMTVNSLDSVEYWLSWSSSGEDFTECKVLVLTKG